MISASQQSRKRTSRSVFKAIGTMVVVGTMMLTTACAADTSPTDPGADSDELVIEGTVIADAELWAAAKAEGKFILYTALSEARQNIILEAFKRDTGITTDIVRLGTAQLQERVISEHGSGVLEADVILTTGSIYADEFTEIGVYEQYTPVGIEAIDPGLFGGNGSWFVSMQSVNGIAYNSALVSEADAPKRYDDLLDPRWGGGKIGMSDVTGGAAWARELWLHDEYGVEYWESMATQNPIIESSQGNVTDMLARGEIEVALALPGNIAAAAADGASVAFVVPEEGLIAYDHHIGLSSSAANVNAAKVYLNWLLSKSGQAAIASAGDYPVTSDGPAPSMGEGATLPARDSGIIVQPDAERFVSFQPEGEDLWFRIHGLK
ncbi:MAG: extracellular solute-binding protein [Cryobacterium sp.]|nr:extracellular solute-binding protein [Cryobacterium sp.]